MSKSRNYFYGTLQTVFELNCMEACMKEKYELLQKIYECGFYMTDLKLFLDTHPNNEEACAVYSKKKQEYTDFLNLFTLKYGEIDDLPWECECEV